MASQQFIPSQHIGFSLPPKIYKMSSLGFPDDHGISSTAVSKPFNLFTGEAVRRMRSEALAPDVIANHAFSSDLAPLQLRGYVPSRAPFIEQAWKHPEVLAIISRVAGIDLVPVCDYEIGHINLSPTPSNGHCTPQRPVVGWHTDAYPFVCIVMLSDCAEAGGGETLIRTRNGGPDLQIRSPGPGAAVILQGRYITHKAMPTIGGAERITMVTSFRPRSALYPTDANLATVRPVSDLNQLYYQYAEYRLEALQERVMHELERLRSKGPQLFETKRTKVALRGLKEMVTRTEAELVEEHLVRMGEIGDLSVR